MQVDVNSSDGILTRARCAFIRSQQAGMLFDCPEEIAIQGLVGVLTSGRSS